jgi:hypothetical protein
VPQRGEVRQVVKHDVAGPLTGRRHPDHRVELGVARLGERMRASRIDALARRCPRVCGRAVADQDEFGCGTGMEWQSRRRAQRCRPRCHQSDTPCPRQPADRVQSGQSGIRGVGSDGNTRNLDAQPRMPWLPSRFWKPSTIGPDRTHWSEMVGVGVATDQVNAVDR